MCCAITTALVVAVIATPVATAQHPPEPNPNALPAAAPPSPSSTAKQISQCAQTSAADPTSAHEPLPDLAAVWQLSRGAGQKVAVIDTGVARHSRLRHLVAGGDYVAQTDGTQDCDAHGTLVAGLIAASKDPDDSFSGVAPDAEVLSIRQSSSAYSSVSATAGTTSTLARAVRYAADSGATVINISEVACGQSMSDASLGAAVHYAAVVKDAVIVAAAGNNDICRYEGKQDSWDDASTIVSPAWYDDYVLTVGSVDSTGTPSEFTVPGPWVDVAAPGESVVSLDPRSAGLTGSVSGTSFAAPLVSGAVALVRSRFTRLRAADVIRLIEATAHAPAHGWDPRVGFGVVDAYAAVSAIDPASITAPRKPGNAPSEGKPLAIPELAKDGHGTARTVAFVGSAGVFVLLALGFAATPRRRAPRTPPSDPTPVPVQED